MHTSESQVLLIFGDEGAQCETDEDERRCHQSRSNNAKKNIPTYIRHNNPLSIQAKLPQ